VYPLVTTSHGAIAQRGVLLADDVGQVGNAGDDVVSEGVLEVVHQVLDWAFPGNQGLHAEAHESGLQVPKLNINISQSITLNKS
jgi:hypothetical protein